MSTRTPTTIARAARTRTAVARDHVGIGLATKISGLGNSTVLRMALIGELPYTISPDRRPMFPVKALEQLRAKVVVVQAAET